MGTEQLETLISMNNLAGLGRYGDSIIWRWLSRTKATIAAVEKLIRGTLEAQRPDGGGMRRTRQSNIPCGARRSSKWPRGICSLQCV